MNLARNEEQERRLKNKRVTKPAALAFVLWTSVAANCIWKPFHD